MAAGTDFSQGLKERIEARYKAGGYKLGWRLLYSPPAVLQGARVAFIGLNPGGNYRPADHAEFGMATGSAYALEKWNKGAPGHSPLQRQVLALFRMFSEPPEKVLAGNLVPFRSPTWEALPHRPEALKFGMHIWTDIINRSRPTIVVGMGREVVNALQNILGVETMERIPVNWGNITGSRGRFHNGVLVGLPHLSRFGIVTRPESAAAMKALLQC